MDHKRFINSLTKRFSLRLHMTLILLATSMAGVLVSKWMLAIGLHNVALRYPVTVLFAYMVFFVAIKVWLWIMTDAPVSFSNKTGHNLLGSNDFSLPLGNEAEPSFAGGGGSFDGGGANGDFGDNPGIVDSGVDSTLGGVGDTIGDAVGGAANDKDGFVLVIVLGALAVLLFSVLGVGLFLVWEAPAVLAEAAFNSVLAASLVRSTKRMNEPDWVGSVFKATWMPFAIVFSMALIAGSAMHHYLPKATRILDVIHMAL